uniref:Fibronectin type-III domain-containing protein n=1 Tax=Amphimedon queenslandica TaxID=400682 RepID=A0A1X7T974_AMPQE
MTVSVIGSEYNAIISNLSPGVLYSYQIVVSNIFGPGLPLTSNHFFTAELAPVGAVTIQSVDRVNDYTVQLVWSPLALTEARGIINNYNINISSYVNGTCNIEPVATDSAPANNNNTNNNINHTIPTRGGVMVPSLMYCLTITANNSIGTGPNSSPVIINGTSNTIH